MIHLVQKPENKIFNWEHANLVRMREQNQMTNLTIVCEDGYVRLHSLVLASASSKLKNTFFAGIIGGMRGGNNRLFFVSGINSIDLRNVIDYLYAGEVRFPAKNGEGFLQACMYLGIDNTPTIGLEGESQKDESDWYTMEEITVQAETLQPNCEIMQLLSPIAAAVVSNVLIRDSKFRNQEKPIADKKYPVGSLESPMSLQLINNIATTGNKLQKGKKLKGFRDIDSRVAVLCAKPNGGHFVPETQAQTTELHTAQLSKSSSVEVQQNNVPDWLGTKIVKKSRALKQANNNQQRQPNKATFPSVNEQPPIIVEKHRTAQKKRLSILALVNKVIGLKTIRANEATESGWKSKLDLSTAQGKNVRVETCLPSSVNPSGTKLVSILESTGNSYATTSESILPPLPAIAAKNKRRTITAEVTSVSKVTMDERKKSALEIHMEEAIERVVKSALKMVQQAERTCVDQARRINASVPVPTERAKTFPVKQEDKKLSSKAQGAPDARKSSKFKNGGSQHENEGQIGNPEAGT